MRHSRAPKGPIHRGGGGAGGHGPLGLPWRLLVLALAMLAIGAAISAAGALTWRSSQRQQERRAFAAAGQNAAATLGSMIQRNADFVTTLRGVLTLQPNMSDSEFKRWYEVLAGREREDGGVGSAVVRVVPAAQLRTFEAARNADPTFRALLGRWLYPVARSGQNRYCLLAAGGNIITLNRYTAELVQQDWCQQSSFTGASQAPLLASAAASGNVLALPLELPWMRTLFLEAAFFGPAGPPKGAQARQRAVRGWLVSSFDIESLISAAIGHVKQRSIALYHVNPGGAKTLLGSAGSAGKGSQLVNERLAIDGNWLVQVRGQVGSPVLGTDAIAAMILIAGLLLSALTTAVAVLLARSRERALQLAADRAGELEYRVLHDSLTGLPNRSLAVDRAKQMLARARRTRVPVAALHIDVDGFKQVNEALGHQVGDQLLSEMAARLQSLTRESDTAARLAGDEFVALVDSGEYSADPEIVAERMLELLREPYELAMLGAQPIKLTISIGLALGVDASADKLLADAAIALDAAKSAGKNRYIFFDSEMQDAARDRLALEMDLTDALAREQFFIHYQPIFDLSAKRMVGVEALLRWRHPRLGVVAPDRFIPIAEAGGLIVPIGAWVLASACRQAQQWREQGMELSIAVNVSARQLESDRLVDDVRLALLDSGLPPDALTLEVTETTLMRDPELGARQLWALCELGARIAIDDFGTGYSSLAYLRQFPVNSLKIDRSFIAAIGESASARALVQTMASLSHNLDLETVAEGVEDVGQLEVVRELGCEFVQGFLFARPMPAEQLAESFFGQSQNGLAAEAADEQGGGVK